MTLGPGALRYILALMVVVHHSFPLRWGAFAVYAFFVLSGYWIARMWTGRYARTRVPYFTFIVSRWWRRAPVFCLCIGLGLLSAHLNPQAIKPPEPFGLWLASQVPVIGSSALGRLLPPTWSLDVEMQFYLLAPAIIVGLAVLPPRFKPLVVVGAAAVTLAYFGRGGGAEAPVVWPFLSCFLLGVVVAQGNWVPSRKVIWVSTLVAVAGTIGLALWPETAAHFFARGSDAMVRSEGAKRLLAAWWVCAVFLLAPFLARNVRQKTSVEDARLGAMAYPLYLFHWIPRDAYYAFAPDGNVGRAAALLVNVAMAVAGAYAIHRWFDEPIDQWRQRWVKSRLLAQPVQPVAATA